MNYIIETILDLLFPRRCPVCGQIIMPKGNLICPGCIRKLSWVRGPVCKCCGKEIISETAEYCSDCAIHPRSFSNGMALLNYNEISAPSLAKIKYHNHREYLDFYAEAAYRKYAARIARLSPDLIHSGARYTKAAMKKEALTGRRIWKTSVPLSGNSNEFQFADPVKKDGTPERFRTCPAP